MPAESYHCDKQSEICHQLPIHLHRFTYVGHADFGPKLLTLRMLSQAVLVDVSQSQHFGLRTTWHLVAKCCQQFIRVC